MTPPTNTDETDDDRRTVTRADTTETETASDADSDGDGVGVAGADADTDVDADGDAGRDATADAGAGEAESDSPDDSAKGTSTESADDPVPPERRAMILDRDKHGCQLCLARGPQAGGLAQLEVHHKDPDPDDMDRHAPENLITLCDGCHNWAHKRPTDDDVPIDLHEEDAAHLLPHDYEILRLLAEDGPLTTGEIAERITPDHSIIAIRERLWLLMGLDAIVEQRDCQLIDQDATTGEWGLPDQIADSERGRIPEDMQALLQRAHDERVRRSLERGCDRKSVAEVFGIHTRTTWHKERRAQAYRFPLEALERRRAEPTSPDREEATITDGGGDGDAGNDAESASGRTDDEATPGTAGQADDADGPAATWEASTAASDDRTLADLFSETEADSQPGTDGDAVGDNRKENHEFDPQALTVAEAIQRTRSALQALETIREES